MGIKAFFKNAFNDMKESTKAQNDEQIAAAQQRRAEAQARIDAIKN